MDWVDEYKNLRPEWRRNPILYAKQRLGLNPAWHQQHLLSAITEPGARVSARSGQGTGKSAAMAVAIWWKLECFGYPVEPLPELRRGMSVYTKWRSKQAGPLRRAVNTPHLARNQGVQLW